MDDERNGPPTAEHDKAVEKLGTFEGIWLSRKVLLTGWVTGCLLLVVVGLACIVGRPTKVDPPQIKPLPRFSQNAPPAWEDVAPQFKWLFPTLDLAVIKAQYEDACNLALARGDTGRGVADRIEKLLFPEVTLTKKSDDSGFLHGKVHNQTEGMVEKLKLSIKTPKWERTYEEKVAVANNATASFKIYIGDAGVEVESFEMLSPWAPEPRLRAAAAKAAIAFGEIVVALGAERLNRFLRVNISVIVEEAHTKQVATVLATRKAFLKSWLIGYLSDQSAQEVTSKGGLKRIRREIRDQFNAMLFPASEEKIIDIDFDEFIVK